jgi:hypothetical protein
MDAFNGEGSSPTLGYLGCTIIHPPVRAWVDAIAPCRAIDLQSPFQL